MLIIKNRKSRNFGFTLIELLIVITVLGILAVAVLSAINPIEMINRGRDTGSRSDAEQLLNAVERYYTSMGYYPWRTGAAVGSDAQAWTRIGVDPWDDGDVDVLDKLSGSAVGTAGTGELKASFISRITGSGYNFLWVWNNGEQGDSTYICFNGKSKSFQTEAFNRCEGTQGSIPADLPEGNVCDVTVTGAGSGQYLSCLP